MGHGHHVDPLGHRVDQISAQEGGLLDPWVDLCDPLGGLVCHLKKLKPECCRFNLTLVKSVSHVFSFV